MPAPDFYAQQQAIWIDEAFAIDSVVHQARQEEEGVLVNLFKIGCDPEFVMLNPPEQLVPADNYLPHDGPIGFDHSGRVAEFRPEPSRNTYLVVQRIQKLALSMEADTWDHEWRAGATVKHHMGFDTLGGHVHIDVPFGSAKALVIVPALDLFTCWLETLDILPRADSTVRRTYKHPHNGGRTYGHFGDIRESEGHLEYRTMASWLYDPRVAMVCLTGAKLAARYPEHTQTYLIGAPNIARLETWFGQHGKKDSNARVTADLVRPAVALDVKADVKEVWSELKGM